MATDALKYRIALSMLPKVGSVTAKKLIAYTGSVEAVFEEKTKNLQKIPGVGTQLSDLISRHRHLPQEAEKEVEFIRKNNIQPLFYLDKTYPWRLKECTDAPIMLYFKGQADLNSAKVLSIVGTRNASAYGKDFCTELVEKLQQNQHHVLIVSGLAYGIDITAHRAALSNQLPTVAVLAHGLNQVYPAMHKATAHEMQKNGGLLTDYMSSAKIVPQNFLRRNRIIAGLADATVVVESAKKGGALVTAEIANSYNREVFALPGRISDTYSQGCNWLIKTHKAALIESVKDVEYLLNWDQTTTKKAAVQLDLFQNLTSEEEQIVNLLKETGEMNIDWIARKTKLSMSNVSALLLNLEFAGLVQNAPGKMFRIKNT